MDLTTTYLGMKLRSPLVASPSPLSESVENVKQLEKAGAGAVVLYSLFEEQVRTEQQIRAFYQKFPNATAADALNMFQPRHFRTGLYDYLTHIQNLKSAIDIPIIASLNCKSLGTWTEFAQKIEEAGADAIELNIYFIPTDMDMTAEHVEELHLRILRAIKAAVSIPVAVKISPFFSNLSNMARRLDQGGANALVLFNRFYEPDFDPKTLKVQPNVQLSAVQDMRLPMHWIALLYGRVKADLAATGGIYTAEDVVKMLMVGASVTMMTSALLKEGIDYLQVVNRVLEEWLDENDYSSVSELQAVMSHFHSKEPDTFERSEYMRAIEAFKPTA